MSPACRTSNAAIPPTSRRREPRSRQPARTARQGQGRGGHELPARTSGSFTQKSHAIPLGHFSRQPIIVAIPTTIFQCLKGCHGNCMRDFWETTSVVAHNRGQFISTRGTGTQPNRRRCTLNEALHPLRSATPVTKLCTRSERVQCLPMGCTAPSATSTNAESPTKVQPDRKHSTRSERVEPYRPQPISTSSSADRRAFLTSTPRPFRARVPGRREHSARTREAGARHELPAGISGSFTQSRT